MEEVCNTLTEAEASICEPEDLNVIYLAGQIPFCFLNRFCFIRHPSMEPAVWTCYEKGVLSQVGIFQSRFHNQCTVVCFFTQGSLGWLFFNVTKQKLSQMNYEATCTGKKLLPVFVIFLLPQFQLNYHIGQGVYISVESFSFFCKYTLSNPFSLFSTFLSLSSKKIKEPQTWGWNPLFVLAQL